MSSRMLLQIHPDHDIAKEVGMHAKASLASPSCSVSEDSRSLIYAQQRWTHP